MLTPQPNTIPTDGSTIMVYIDGVPVGHPTYNQFRGDVAALFPGLNNSDGAVGYFMIDRTTLSNGVHTISWGVTDNAGNAEGIGSRYFTVLNGATAIVGHGRDEARASSRRWDRRSRCGRRPRSAIRAGQLAHHSTSLPVSQTPVYLRTGFDQTAPLESRGGRRQWREARQRQPR